MDKKYIESIGQAYQQVQEKKKLKGGQVKLDKDKDGDIDGDDFAAMRKKKELAVEASIPDDCTECPKCEGKGCDHCDDKGYHKDVEEAACGSKKPRKEAACGSGKKVRKEDEEIVMNPKKKKEKGQEASDQMAQETTKWPVYNRIMEKNAVNQNAVAPEPLIPADSKLKDDQAVRVNQSQDHISAAAAQWIKDHEGNQVPADAVDHEKIVAKNAQDLMKTVPGKANDAVNKGAVAPEAIKKVEG